MDAARPLRDVFADLAHEGGRPADPAEVLRAHGHGDLPDALVAEAVGSYADTAPVEVAEHLSPYVMAHSPVPLAGVAEVDPASWLDAVATAPPLIADPGDHGLDQSDHDLDPMAPADLAHADVAHVLAGGLDFGHGNADEAASFGDTDSFDDEISGPGFVDVAADLDGLTGYDEPGLDESPATADFPDGNTDDGDTDGDTGDGIGDHGAGADG